MIDRIAIAISAVALLILGASLWLGLQLNLLVMVLEHIVLGLLLWKGMSQAKKADGPIVLRFGLWQVCLIYATLMALSVFVLVKQPITADEASYVFQAKLISRGMLFAEAPPGYQEFAGPMHFNHHIMRNGRFFTQYTAGWPALLSLGERIGMRSWINPIFGLLYIFLTYLIGREWFGNSTGLLAALLLAVSPSFLHLSQGYLAHVSCGVILAAAFWFAGRGGVIGIVLPPLLVALAGATRLYTALAVGGVLFLFVLYEAGRSKKAVGIIVAWAVAISAMLAWTSYYNFLMMGDPAVSPYSVNFPVLFITTPKDLAVKLVTQVRWSLQGTMFYAGCWVIAMAIIGITTGGWKKPKVLALAASFGALIVAHIPLNFVSGQYFGERYYSEAYFALVILAAHGFLNLYEKLHMPRAVLAQIAILFLVFEIGHLAAYATREHALAVPLVAMNRAIENAARKGGLILAAEPFGRDMNFNDPEWRAKGYLMFEDPGPGLREAIARRVGMDRVVLLDYDGHLGRVVENDYRLELSH